jgi:ribulose-5-phosphate 4-epimerase/fuculose-1-phosphate aldolase
VNPAGFTIHSCIHEVREDATCVLHTHSRAGVAVSAQKAGVLPISQQSTFVLASLAYHGYEGVALRDEEKPRLQARPRPQELPDAAQPRPAHRRPSVPEAFLSMYTFENTCRIQIDAQAGGGELVYVDPIMEGMAQVLKTVTAGQGANIAWPALLRQAGSKTDPSYKT